MNSWGFFLFLLILCLIVQGFFSMMEMACVSFNKVRLLYFVGNEKRRAIWLNRLLSKPGRLFGTTLIGVNLTLQLGSEASRRLYESLNLSPDLAPISQIFLVLIFAELSPMFAGRKFPEHVAMAGIGVIYFCSILLKPITFFFDLLSRGVNRLINRRSSGAIFLTKEELQNVLEERAETRIAPGSKRAVNAVMSNIFSLKNKTAKGLMFSLKKVQMISSDGTIEQLRSMVQTHYSPFVPVYHHRFENIVGVVHPRDLLRSSERDRVMSKARAPWFITESGSILQILEQFQHNNQSVAIVLNRQGAATGILTLDVIINEIFSFSDQWTTEERQIMVDRRLTGDILVADFNQTFGVELSYEEEETLGELMARHLGHTPSKGEVVRLDQFEFTIEEAPLIGQIYITVRSQK